MPRRTTRPPVPLTIRLPVPPMDAAGGGPKTSAAGGGGNPELMAYTVH
jgi:hypothetical protein